MQITINQKMSFGRPVIGPKHYLATGASGWIETFLKVEADKALKTFIGRLCPKELVDNFLEHLALDPDKKRARWPDVTAYLGRIVRVHPDKIPIEVAVAFWAQIVKIEDQAGGN